jgi:GH18 family chitinase
MKKHLWLSLAILSSAVLVSCLRQEINSPLLPTSDNYVGDALAADINQNGVADILEACQGDVACVDSTAAVLQTECSGDESCLTAGLATTLDSARTHFSLPAASSSATAGVSTETGSSAWMLNSSGDGTSSVLIELSSGIVLSSEIAGISADAGSSAISASSAATGTSSAGITGCPAWTRKSYSMPIIGFHPSWVSYSVPWTKITHLNYAFGLPNTDGSFSAPSLASLAQQGHAQGVEVWISIGGANNSANFLTLAANTTSRTNFVNSVTQYLQDNCLDGVDIDWEHWTGSNSGTVITSESQSLIDMLAQLTPAVHALGGKVSLDAYGSDWNGRHYLSPAINYLDWLNVMAYDFTGPWSAEGNHSTYANALSSLNYWANRFAGQSGYAKSKLMLGVPFYGKDWDQAAASVTYSQILAQYSGAAEDADSKYNRIYYNAKPLLRDKVNMVKIGLWGGIMIWELSQDNYTSSATSLLDAIWVSSGN